MGLLKDIIGESAKQAVDTAIDDAFVTGVYAAAKVVETAADATQAAIDVAGKGYDKVRPGIVKAATGTKEAIESATKKIQNTIIENNIKNTFAKRKNNFHYLINCSASSHGIYTYEIFNEKMQKVCSATCKKNMFTYTVQLVDEDNTLLLELKQKGMNNDVLFINDSVKVADPQINQRIKTYAAEGNVLSKTVTYKDDDIIVGHSEKKKDYVGGQYVLDMPDSKYTLPLLAQEIIRETRGAK